MRAARLSRISTKRGRGVGRAQQCATDTCFTNTGRSERATAVADGDLAALEVAEEFLPIGVGGCAVFVGGAERPPPGEERQVRLIASSG